MNAKILTVGNLKTNFSEVLNDIRRGEEYVVEYGKKHEKVACIIPYSKYKNENKLKLGLLKDKGKISFKKKFKITEREFLNGL